MSYVVHEDRPAYDVWLITLLVGILLVVIGLLLFQTPGNTGDALTAIGVVVFIILLLRTLLPRRFQITSDKLRIVLGWPFAVNIPLKDITGVKPRTGIAAFIFTGLRFATSAGHTIEVARKGGMDIIFSPRDHERFLEKLNEAREQVSLG